MPVRWDAIPPPFQIDPESLQNFHRARPGQGFNAVVDTARGMIFFHPYHPVIGDVEFRREGSPLGPALAMPGGNGGGHAWVMNHLTRDWLRQKEYGGFSFIKMQDDHGVISIKITFRSGLNTVCFTNRPPHMLVGDREEQERIMPPRWVIALSDFLIPALSVPIPAAAGGFAPAAAAAASSSV